MMDLNKGGVATGMRGDVFNVDYGTVKGSEQGGIRPVMIVQNDIGNKYSPTVIVVPFTSQITKAKLPTHVEVKGGQFGLTKDSVVLCEQIRTLDKNHRLLDKIGEVDAFTIARIDEAMEISLNLGKSKSKFVSREEKDVKFRIEYIKGLEVTIANAQSFGGGKDFIDKLLNTREQSLKVVEILCRQNKINFNKIYIPFIGNLAV